MPALSGGIWHGVIRVVNFLIRDLPNKPLMMIHILRPWEAKWKNWTCEPETTLVVRDSRINHWRVLKLSSIFHSNWFKNVIQATASVAKILVKKGSLCYRNHHSACPMWTKAGYTIWPCYHASNSSHHRAFTIVRVKYRKWKSKKPEEPAANSKSYRHWKVRM